jgi:hypothetical protein
LPRASAATACRLDRQFVLDANLNRRHLNESQRGMIAAEIANIRHGDRADYADRSLDLSAPPAISYTKAATLLNVSEALDA